MYTLSIPRLVSDRKNRGPLSRAAWAYVTECSGGICDREHSAAGSYRTGSCDVRLPTSLSVNKHLKGLSSCFGSWAEDRRLIRFSVYSTVAHLIINLIALACLCAVVASIVPCETDRPGCPRLVATKPAWIVLSTFILLAEFCESDDEPVWARCTNDDVSRSQIYSSSFSPITITSEIIRGDRTWLKLHHETSPRPCPVREATKDCCRAWKLTPPSNCTRSSRGRRRPARFRCRNPSPNMGTAGG